MDILITFAGKVLEFALKPVGRQFRYVIFYNRNIDGLKNEAEKLKAEREDVENMVRAAENNNEVISDAVQLWRHKVDEITVQAESFFVNESDANAGCSRKSCPNLWLRYKLSRQAKKMAAEVGELNGKGNFKSVSTGRKLPQAVGDSSVVGDAFKSRVSTMNEIMEALADPAIHMIGLYGLGGVGKTTIAKQVAKKAQDEKLFDKDKVFFVEVKRYEIEEIQSQIACLVGLEFGKECKNETVRANELRQRLEKEKSFLIVLDDLWERLDFKRVGIPSADEGNAHRKFILTSRREDLLSARMNCKKNIVVGLLSEEEAWGLFKKTAEINDNDNSDLVSIANEVSQKCAQLPVAIVAVAGALRNNNNLADWRDALRRLKGHLSRNVSAIEQVDSSIKLSYECLGRKELKSIFLYSAMFSQDPLIMDLFMYVVGLELLGGIHNLKEARDALDSSLRKLKASSLLLDSYSKDRFTIHDVVRDVALSIAFEENHALVKRREKVDDWPNEYQPESCTAICLDECDIVELPKELYGPKVEFFYLHSKDIKLNIPSNLFSRMEKLKVLSLSNMTFSSLASFSLPKKLTTLSLHSCELEDITAVKHLKELKVLNLSNSRIKQLPYEVGQLSCLKILNLSRCYQLKVIPPNLLSNLKKLEELYMGGTYSISWEAERLNEGKEGASLHELKHLQKLSALEIHIPDASFLPKDLFLENSLERYKISIGGTGSFYGREFSRVLTLSAYNANMEYGVFRLFERVEDLTLENLNGIASLYQSQITAQTFGNLSAIKVEFCDQLKSLFSVSRTKQLAKLETIEVSYCKSLEEIVAFVNEENVEEGSARNVIELRQLHSLTLDHLPVLTNFCSSNKVTFPNLENLILASINCPNIWDIFTSKSSGTQSHVTAQTFCKLGTIKVRSCDQLKSLFLVSMAGILSRLESIEVSECKSLEEIVAFEDDENVEKGSAMNVIEFLQLRFLKLNNLPALTDICFSDKVAFPKLETLTLASVNCHNIWHIPTSIGSRTQIVESSQMGAAVNDSLPNRSFSNLKTLKVFKCHFLLKLIPSHILKSLSNLEELEIIDCDSLAVVFDFGEFNNYKETHTFRLKTLLLNHLPTLEAVWSRGFQGIINFQSLQKFKIRNCHKLEIFQAVDGKVAFPVLETLSLASVNCHDIWHIPTSIGSRTQIVEIVESSQIEDSLLNRSFSNLKTLRVVECHFLLKLIPLHILKSVSNLEELEIRYCDSLEVVFDFGEFNNYKETHTFRLKTLVLSHLPTLEAVWSRGLQGIVSFQSLQKLEISNCNKLDIFQAVDEKVFPKLEELELDGRQAEMMWNGEFRMYRFSTVKVLSLSGIYDKAATFPYGLFYGFPKLEKLEVEECSFLVIFSCPKRPLDNDARKATSIERLNLSFMKKLKHIWDGKCQLDNVLQNVKALDVSYCDELINLGPSFVSLENLTELDVHDCDGLINLLTSSTARTLVQLRSLKIERCEKMEEIVTNGEDVENEIVFPKLKKLELNQLLSCRSFCCHNHTLNFTLLDEVTIKECPKFRIFCGGVITTPLLKSVKVGNDEIHWQSSLNNTIQQLFNEGLLFAVVDHLHVKNDEYPELIDVWNEKLAAGRYLTNLTSLVMDNCSFLSNHVIPSYILTSFFNLKELEVRNCESVEVVFDLEGLDIDKEAHTLQAIPLGSLRIKHLPNLKYVWNKDPHTIHCFQGLSSMSAYECENLRSIFPASIAKGLINLSSLKIESCGIEVIVAESQNPTSTIHFEFPRLDQLSLKKLPNPKNFYPQRHTVEWPRLKSMNVRQCKKVKVFSWEEPEITEKEAEDGVENEQYALFLFEQVAFPVLETLSLASVNCHDIWHIPTSTGSRIQIVEIVESSQIEDSLLNRSFSNLKTLRVEECHFLSKLIPLHIVKSLSNLEVLEIRYCDSLEVVFDFGEFNNYKEAHTFRLKTLLLSDLPKLEAVWSRGFQGIINFQSLQKFEIRNCDKLEIFQAVDEKVFPKLEELELDGRQGKMMWNGEFRMYHFSTVKVLSLSGIDDKAATFPYGLFYGFPKLEQLDLRLSSFSVIFSYLKRPLDNDARKDTSIERLNLSNMKKLKHIWDGKCQLDHVLQNVKALDVSYCDELINLGPSSVSLENLTELNVYRCDGLINLLTSSTARTLVQLRSLKIESCEKMEEIVTNGEDVENEIVFPKLKKLELNQLLSCRSFCCHNHTLNFTLLDEVTIKECPRFRIFCGGVITTPLLKGVKVGNDEIHWQSNLNNTIQQLFNEGLKKLDVKNDEYPELIDVWNGKFAAGRYLTNLTYLVMDNCSFLSNHVIPSYILTSFFNLKELEVRNCESVEVVFDLEGLDIDKEAHTLQAIPLRSLRIKHLPNLKYVWNKDPHTIHCFQHLWCMSVYECENLRSIFPASIARGLINLWWLHIESWSLTLNQNHIKIIRNGQIQENIFSKVDRLTVDSFYEDEPLDSPYTFLERFPELQNLEVSHSSFKSIFSCEGPPNDSQMDPVLRRLNQLNVNHCYRLINLAPSSASFDNLRELNVSGCHCLGYLLTTLTAKSLVHLYHLVIKDCKIMEEIVTNKGEDVEDKIVFERLKNMKLIDLPDLKSFSSQICTFEFPSLTDVTIRSCSKMKMFCPKVLATPLLEDIKIEENEERWEGNLNKTLEKLFLEKEGLDSLKS